VKWGVLEPLKEFNLPDILGLTRDQVNDGCCRFGWIDQPVPCLGSKAEITSFGHGQYVWQNGAAPGSRDRASA
jgi:hypothetical protein